MPSELAPAAAASICEHMNDDHAEALAAYARHFGGIDDAVSARMVAIDSRGMDLEVRTPAGVRGSRIAFDHHVDDAHDARVTLVAMASAAGSPDTHA